LADGIQPLCIGYDRVATHWFWHRRSCGRDWLLGRLGTRLDLIFRRCCFVVLHFRRAWRDCSRSSCFFHREEGLEGRGGVGIDRTAGFLKRLHVTRHEGAPLCDVDSLVEQRDDVVAQALESSLWRKIRAIKRICACDANWNRQQRACHLDNGYEPSQLRRF